MNKPATERWAFSVRQGGVTVASGDAPTEAVARREATHYAMMYAQDGGAVTVKINRRGKR
jgi:hypothetical protein